ncbi:MAG: hypothetical protein KatS3mg121_1052 [Gammaproteobacteria bacterium]|nr:MAG: hypothetical protein KatS3mg121_1052 [Gammaproteobacteria bacterium]
MRNARGFTLIELVVVIVLLGILGAVATARFQNLAAQAADAVEQGVAAELTSGSAINYAVAAAGGSPAVTISGAAVDCATVAPNLLQTGALPANVTVTGTVNCSSGAGTTGTCTVTHADGTTTNATATLYCTG